MFGLGHKSELKIFEKSGKFGVGESVEFVPSFSFDSKQEAQAYIDEHGKEVEEENGD